MRVLLLMFLLAVMQCVFLVAITKKEKPINYRKQAVDSACKINVAKGSGSGVYLDSGYVITAAHVVDPDLDGKIETLDRVPLLYFYNEGEKHPHLFDIAYISTEIDVAFLTPHITYTGEQERLDAIPKARASLKNGMVGDQVFSVGAIQGDPPMVFGGFLSPQWDGYHRASTFTSQGCSGGGMFKDDNLLGVVTNVRLVQDEIPFEVLIPLKEGITVGLGNITYSRELADSCIFTSIVDVRDNLNERGLALLLDKQQPPTFIENLQEPYTYGLIRVGINLALFFGLLVYIRKHILG